jgi:hypothetical protein
MADADGQPSPDSSDSSDSGTERTRALVEYFSEANEQLETVNRIVAAVNTGRSIEEVFELASEQVRALVPFDRASLALCEEDGETLRVYALTGERAGSLAVGARGPLKGSVTELALTERRTVVIPELSEERRFNVYSDLRREGLFGTRPSRGCRRAPRATSTPASSSRHPWSIPFTPSRGSLRVSALMPENRFYESMRSTTRSLAGRRCVRSSARRGRRFIRFVTGDYPTRWSGPNLHQRPSHSRAHRHPCQVVGGSTSWGPLPMKRV